MLTNNKNRYKIIVRKGQKVKEGKKMNLVDMIEQYLKKEVERCDNDILEVKRSDLAELFSCVPSQINYVISTRFAPEMGFYVETRRGGGGYIRIKKVDVYKEEIVANIFDKIDNKLSQRVVDIYLKVLLDYNIINESVAEIIKVATSDKSLKNLSMEDKDITRANIFKNVVLNVI